jgi:hypothetical protein
MGRIVGSLVESLQPETVGMRIIDGMAGEYILSESISIVELKSHARVKLIPDGNVERRFFGETVVVRLTLRAAA